MFADILMSQGISSHVIDLVIQKQKKDNIYAETLSPGNFEVLSWNDMSEQLW